jgi:hypothetical protein
MALAARLAMSVVAATGRESAASVGRDSAADGNESFLSPAGCGAAFLSSGCSGAARDAPVRSGDRRPGLRCAASIASRSAADRVRRYPAAYTPSTAAELNATRLLPIFLFDALLPLGDAGRLFCFMTACIVRGEDRTHEAAAAADAPGDTAAPPVPNSAVSLSPPATRG